MIVTNNMFGDIITDLAAGLQGGLGMAASGNLHPGRTSMFEPVHGSAPPIAGKNIANPFGAILSAAMMLAHLGMKAEAEKIEAAVLEAVRQKKTTPDIGGTLGDTRSGRVGGGESAGGDYPNSSAGVCAERGEDPTLCGVEGPRAGRGQDPRSAQGDKLGVKLTVGSLQYSPASSASSRHFQ